MSEYHHGPKRDFEHEARLQEFLRTMHAGIDAASSHYDPELRNNGQLMVPYGDGNLRACKWETICPELPSRFSAMLPFRSEELVTVHTRLRHGVARALINVWVSNVEEPFRNLSMSIAVDPNTGEYQDSVMNSAGGDHGESPIVEQDMRAILGVLFEGNEDYANGANNMTVGNAYTLGVLSQPDHVENAEHYTTEHGVKEFATDGSANGFRLDISRYVRNVDGEPRTKLTAQLQRDFSPSEYDPTMLYRGFLEQKVVIDCDSFGTIVEAERTSRVMLYDDPCVTKINGKDSVVALATEHGNSLPDVLQAKLYQDNVVRPEDLAFFTRLATQPITEEDTYI